MQCCSVPCSYDFCHCISLSFYFYVFFYIFPFFVFFVAPFLSFFLPLSLFLFLSLPIYCRCCSLLSQCPAHFCDIMAGSVQIGSAAGEGGEWDAGCSESGAGSHHTVLRPWNVSGTPTKTINRAASLSSPPSLCCLIMITSRQVSTIQEQIQYQKSRSLVLLLTFPLISFTSIFQIAPALVQAVTGLSVGSTAVETDTKRQQHQHAAQIHASSHCLISLHCSSVLSHASACAAQFQHAHLWPVSFLLLFLPSPRGGGRPVLLTDPKASGWLSFPFTLFVSPFYSLILPSTFTSFFASLLSTSRLSSPPPVSVSSHPASPSLSSCCVVGLQLVLRGMSEALVDRRAAPALITLCSGPELWVNFA